MTSKTNIRTIALAVMLLVGGMFALSAIVEFLMPGSWSQRITAIVYAGAAIVALPAAAMGITVVLRVAWRQAEASRSILEIPTKNGPRYFIQMPADQKSTLLILNEDEISGVELGNGEELGHRVKRTPEARPTYLRAELPFPMAQRNEELLHDYIHQRGGNGR